MSVIFLTMTMRGKWEAVVIVASLVVLIAVTLISLWQLSVIETAPAS